MESSTRQASSPEQREERRRKRHESRASATFKTFARTLCDALALREDVAVRAAASVLCVLEQRLVSNEANHLEAQLPDKLKELLVRCDRHEELRPRDIGRNEFLAIVSGDLGIPLHEAEDIVRGVFKVLTVHVSAGELEDVLSMLPHDLRELWPPLPEPMRRDRAARPARNRRSPELTEPVQQIVDHVLALPLGAQLGVLRTVAPRIVGRLGGVDREGFLRDLNEEIAHFDRGEPAYDIRPNVEGSGEGRASG